MKNILIVVGMLVVFNALFVFSGGLDKLWQTEQKQIESPQKIDDYIIDVFRSTLEEEVQTQIGQPVEGYEPHMFLEVFPGLVETDFDRVDASIGHYVIKNGRLEHKMGDAELIHSAATAVTRKGMEVLLQNVATRAEIDLFRSGTITDIMDVITSD